MRTEQQQQGGSPGSPQSRYWCFTLNNYTREHDYRSPFGPQLSYWCAGREVGESGTRHLQGYIELKSRQRLSYLRAKMPGAHWEMRRGSGEEASTYCKKDGDFDEWGSLCVSNQGKRSDLEAVADSLKSGKTISEVASEYPVEYIKYAKGIHALKSSIDASQAKKPPRVVVFWGETGTGKSYKVSQESPDVYFTSNCKWYDGYDGQRDICFDDYEGQITLANFLRLLDRYPVTVENKGGSVQFNPTRIYITSHFHPRQWYREQVDRYPELERRIHECREFVRRTDGTGTEVGGNTVPPLLAQPPVFHE